MVDTLLDVCKRNAPVFQRYFRLKARWLGVERIRRYDIYAPVAKSDKKYEFSDAAGMVLESFHGFTPKIAAMVQRVIDEQHLDSEVRKGKQSGAFCYSVAPELAPWVLVNFQGRPDDVATLAHELGHAIHSMLASRPYPVHLPLFAAAGRDRLYLRGDDPDRSPACAGER